MAEQDLQSKICRAVRALLIEESAGSTADTIASPSAAARSLPLTAINAGDAKPFDGPGNWQMDISITLLDAAPVQPDEANDQASRISANERMTKVVDALMKSDDTHTTYYTAQRLTTLGRALAVSDGSASGDQRALDNADMAEFTVLWWEADGIGSAGRISGDKGTFWERELKFNCVACNANLTS